MVSRTRKITGIAALYAIMLSIVVFATFQARRAALRDAAASPKSQAEWTQWREDVQAKRVSDDGAVSRRTPKSIEPPWVVLMRDHYGVCLAAAIIFSSLLFVVTAFFITAARK